ncbi:MAG: sugar phosphate nucleotidyltransferase, partial [Sandaracinaceae bacterium]
MTRAFTIVMAGGSGTRFWPLSRAGRPKQLLPLAGGEESLLAAIHAPLPGLGEALDRFRAAALEDEGAVVLELFPTLPSVSIDH